MSVTSTTMTIDAHFNAGPHSGSEHFEAWLRNTIYGATWVRMLDTVVAGAVNPSFGPITGLPPGVPHDVACRLTRSGAAQAGSTSADPTTWPAAHRQMAVQLLLDDLVDAGSFVGDALGAPGHSIIWAAFQRTNSDSQDLTPHGGGFDQPDWGDPRYEWEVDTGTGYVPLNGFVDNQTTLAHNLAHGRWYGDVTVAAWNADVYNLDTVTIGFNVDVEAYAGSTIDVRVRRVMKTLDDVTVLQTSNWTVLAGLVIPA